MLCLRYWGRGDSGGLTADSNVIAPEATAYLEAVYQDLSSPMRICSCRSCCTRLQCCIGQMAWCGDSRNCCPVRRALNGGSRNSRLVPTPLASFSHFVGMNGYRSLDLQSHCCPHLHVFASFWVYFDFCSAQTCIPGELSDDCLSRW